MQRTACLLAMTMAVSSAAMAEQVTITGASVYVTKADCAALVQHRPAADVAYKPGADLHGKYVAPADLPGSDYSGLVPDKIPFNVAVNPLTYGQVPGASTKYANTAVPVAHLEVDTKTGQASLNGKPLTGYQDQTVLEACRKAGLR